MSSMWLKHKIRFLYRNKRCCHSVKMFTPRRAVLYVPGNDERKMSKASNLNVDCVVLDCEDGVAMSKKTEARNTIKKFISQNEFCKSSKYCVRVNSAAYNELFFEDMHIFLSGSCIPHTFLLPKVESADHLHMFSDCLTQFKISEIPYNISLLIYIESPGALLNISNLHKTAVQLSQNCPFTLEGMLFGSDDFCASIGAIRSQQASEVLTARQMFVMSVKSLGLQAIDMVHTDLQDLEGLKIQAEEGMNWGFTGKQVIHPSQIEIVQNCFKPTDKQITWAKELIDAFEQQQQEGKVDKFNHFTRNKCLSGSVYISWKNDRYAISSTS